MRNKDDVGGVFLDQLIGLTDVYSLTVDNERRTWN